MNKILTIAILLFTTITFAQNSVNGKVIDNVSREPLLGATVLVKGTNNASTTNFDGEFTVNASIGDVIAVSYVGYKTKEITLSDLNNVNVILEEDIAGLDAVVVVGYGTQSVKEITGAVSVVKAETIENLKPTRVEQALQGQVAGVNVTSNSGSPGAPLNIRIRGLGTNGDNRPLILVDGNVVEDLSIVNPNDIESLSVLKDASAGIYGVRGANGVIIITTKQGRKNQKLTFEYDAYVGFQETSRKLPTLNSRQYALLINEAFANNGEQVPFNNLNALTNTDYQDEIFKKAPIFSNTLGVRGGTEKSSYNFGMSLLKQDGIVGLSKSGFTRGTFKADLTHDWTNDLTMDVGLTYIDIENSGINESGLGSVLFNAINIAPTIPVRDRNGDFSLAENLGNEVINPLAQLENTFNKANTRRLLGNFGLSYSFWENFEAKAKIQYSYAETFGDNFTPIAYYGAGKVFNIDNPIYGTFSNYFRNYTYDATLNYANTFNEVHNLTVLAGMSAYRTTGKLNGTTGIFDANNPATADVDFFNARIGDADTITDNFENGGDTFDARLLSHFARLQYDYDGTYIFSAVIRRDGSTKFGPENKFGIFPSASAGWVVSNEEFMSDSAISFLKLRGSVGALGNDRIRDYGFVSVLNGEGAYVFDNEIVLGSAPGALSNPEIKWETQIASNIGLDANFLEDRLTFTFDAFQRETRDLLFVPPVSGILGVGAPGASPPTINGGDIRNRGIELAVSYSQNVNDDFNFTISANAGYLDNEVTSINSASDFFPDGAFGVGQLPPSRFEVGQPIGYFYGYKTDGVFQNNAEIAAHPSQSGLGAVSQPGDLKYVDVNGDGVITTDDRTYIGDPVADITGGLNLTINYNNFDFGTYLFASAGNEIVRNYERSQSFTNTTTNVLNRWTGPGSTNEFPRVTNGATNNNLFSDFFVEDGSFLRVQNLQLGYTLENNFVKSNDIKQLRFYASINNLVTFTKYRGYDPSAIGGAAVGGGIDPGFYPVPRTFLIGTNVKF